MTTNKEDNESAMIIVLHPRAVKEIFLDCTASFDYKLHVSVDGRELQNLDPNVYYNGYEMTFYWNDSFDCVVGTRIVITLTFWYKEKIVKYHMGSENIRRDEMSQATEHWTYEADEQFHIDPEDVDPTNFIEMLKPEWRRKRYETISIPGINDGRVICGHGKIIDVDFTEVESEENACSQEKIKQIETHT
jgi:hypothetical protein